MTRREIGYTIRQTALDWMLVAATDLGLCAVAFGDDPDAIVRELRARFPHARVTGADTRVEELADQVVGAVESSSMIRGLALDVVGTTFEHRVWHALREIPVGATTTYSAIAARIGAPGSSREVGEACAANPLAVVIPCHRVVRKDGTLGGYRWGVRRKRALLTREAARQIA